MTSQPKSDVDGQGEPARAAADQQQNSDIIAKSYRYLRLAMVGLLLFLGVAVAYQSWHQGSLLGSVSAYYYTPAQAIFVAGLIGLGACMIALRGTTTVEDAALNLGGVFATIVAIVPTSRNADYRAAVRACSEADTPLLTDKASTGLDCPTVQALADATKANVDNNLFALLVVGAIALLATLVVARKDGTLKLRADSDAKGNRTRMNSWWGFGLPLILWLAILIARLTSLQSVIDNGHWIAAVLLFVCIFVVALANAQRVKKEHSDDGLQGQSLVRQSIDASSDLFAKQRRDRYITVARLMLGGAVVTLPLWLLNRITLFWVESVVFLLFMVFWTVQTFELDSRQVVILQPPHTPRPTDQE